MCIRDRYFNDNARGDSCMILTLGKKDGSVKLASLERGMGVPILEGQYEGCLLYTSSYADPYERR